MATESFARRWPAILWAIVVLAVIVQQVQFWQGSRLDTDVLALLPEDEQAPVIGIATRKLSEQVERQVIVLVGSADREAAHRAAMEVRSALEGAPEILRPVSLSTQLDQAVDFYRPWRDRLLTSEQRNWLNHVAPDELQALALMRLYQPVGGSALSDIRRDPLGLWQAWWSARAAETRVRPGDGLLWLEAEGKHWALLNYQRQGTVFSMTGDTRLDKLLTRARTAAQQAEPQSRMLAAGVPLHAEAVAAQSNYEMSLIGFGSLGAVLVLVWLTFRSLRPIVLVGLSLVVGCIVGLSVTALVFGHVHLLTLVFGASLVGVAEDYGFHYFAARQGRPASERWEVLHHLLPGLTLALATSAIAYMALGLAPFPGLRQMAVFSAAGLLAAFLTVLCWFPLFDRGELRATRFSTKFAASLAHWPRWQMNRSGLVFAVIVGLFAVVGLLKLESHDDLRQLQSSPASLIAQQIEVGRLLNLPSPAQFFLIEGDSEEQLLVREEALTANLARLKMLGVGYRAVSDWLPSAARQSADAESSARGETVALVAMSELTGERLSRPAFAAGPLKAGQWLNSPAAGAAGGQWLGNIQGRYYSVVLLNGLTTSVLPSVAVVGSGLSGVRWVDRTSEFSDLLARYRAGMEGLLVLGFIAVFVALSLRFKRSAWRALLPTLLGTLLVLAIFGWSGVPLQLFMVLALVLLLGMGVDYGIFLLEHPGDGAAWLAVALAGVSTLLSFGLLALSSTPALHVFGLTMLIGEALIWVLTPYFRSDIGSDDC